MNKKYLIIAPGESIHTYKWIKELTKHFEVYLFTLTKPNDPIQNLLPNTRIFEYSAIWKLIYKNKLLRVIAHTVILLFKLPKIIKKVNPEIINAHYLGYDAAFTTWYVKSHKIDTNLIMSTWGSDILVAPTNSKIQYNLLKYIFKNANVVTCECEHLKNNILKIYAKTKVYQFIFGVEHFDANVKEMDKNYDLYFSNRMLSRNYNIGKVISFFYEISKNKTGLHLYIAGDGPDRSLLEKQVKSYGITDNISFLGMLSQSEQNKYYKMCGYYVSLPKSDSIAVSLLEAMSYGCIPIVSDLPSNREIVNDGVNGYIYDEKNLNYPVIDGAFNYNREYIKKFGIMDNLFNSFVKDLKLDE